MGKKIIVQSLALFAVLALPSCRADFDFEKAYISYDERLSSYTSAFESVWGKIDKDQSWDFWEPETEPETVATTRSASTCYKYTKTWNTGKDDQVVVYNGSQFYDNSGNAKSLPESPSRDTSGGTDFYKVPSDLLNWISTNMPEKANQYGKYGTFDPVWPSKAFYIIPIYQGMALDWDFYLVPPHICSSSGYKTSSNLQSNSIPLWTKGDIQLKGVSWFHKYNARTQQNEGDKWTGEWFDYQHTDHWGNTDNWPAKNEGDNSDWFYVKTRESNNDNTSSTDYTLKDTIINSNIDPNVSKGEVRGPIIKIDPTEYNKKHSNVTGTLCDLYLDIKRVYNNKNSSWPGRKQFATTEQMRALPIGQLKDKLDLNQIKNFDSTFDPSIVNPDLLWLVGAEDNNIKDNSYTDCDYDYNDIVFLVIGADMKIEGKKRYMVEDLGATETSDIDFNDIVIDFENVYSTTVANQIDYQIVTIMALGGTLDFQIGLTENGQLPSSELNAHTSIMWIFQKSAGHSGINNGWTWNSSRWSELGSNSPTTNKMYNTGKEGYRPGDGVADDDAHGKASDVDYGAYICTKQFAYADCKWNIGTNNLVIKMMPNDITVDPNDPLNKEHTDLGGDTGEWWIKFPDQGKAPAIIAFNGTKQWRLERDGITMQECNKDSNHPHKYYWFTNDNNNSSSGSGN